MAEADLLSLGSHCEHPDCSLLDFLPFHCDACGHVYCLDHRTYEAHSWSMGAGKESTTLVCPVCAKAVKLVPGQDANAAFEAHTSKVQLPENPIRKHALFRQFYIRCGKPSKLLPCLIARCHCRTVTPATMPKSTESSSALFQGVRRS